MRPIVRSPKKTLVILSPTGFVWGEESRSFVPACPAGRPSGLRMTVFRSLVLCFVLLTASCAFRSTKSFYFGTYSEAEQFYSKGQYEKAIQKYQAYIDENPEGNLAVISQYYMAKSHAALGHSGEAKALYQQIAQKYPDLVWANFSKTQLKELDGSASAEKKAVA